MAKKINNQRATAPSAPKKKQQNPMKVVKKNGNPKIGKKRAFALGFVFVWLVCDLWKLYF